MIEQRRAERGISQRKLATRADAYIAKMETWERTNTSLDVLRLAKTLKA